AMPNYVGFPEIWLLGSSATGSQMAASLDVGYAFAHHINTDNAVDDMRTYRAHFQPSKHLEQAYAPICASVICAETNEEAERLASSVALAIVRLRSGQPIQFPSPEEAAAYPYTPAERAQAQAYRNSTQIIGDPASVRSQLDELAEKTS